MDWSWWILTFPRPARTALQMSKHAMMNEWTAASCDKFCRMTLVWHSWKKQDLQRKLTWGTMDRSLSKRTPRSRTMCCGSQPGNVTTIITLSIFALACHVPSQMNCVLVGFNLGIFKDIQFCTLATVPSSISPQKSEMSQSRRTVPVEWPFLKPNCSYGTKHNSKYSGTVSQNVDLSLPYARYFKLPNSAS